MYGLQRVSGQVKQTHARNEEEEEGVRAAAADGGLREVKFRSKASEQKTSWINKVRIKNNVQIFIFVLYLHKYSQVNPRALHFSSPPPYFHS